LQKEYFQLDSSGKLTKVKKQQLKVELQKDIDLQKSQSKIKMDDMTKEISREHLRSIQISDFPPSLATRLQVLFEHGSWGAFRRAGRFQI